MRAAASNVGSQESPGIRRSWKPSRAEIGPAWDGVFRQIQGGEDVFPELGKAFLVHVVFAVDQPVLVAGVTVQSLAGQVVQPIGVPIGPRSPIQISGEHVVREH